MAKFTASIYFPDLVGSIGGLTIQDNLSGPTIRIKPYPPKLRTAKQSEEIQIFSNLSQQYLQLSRPNKILWDTFAQANPHITLYNQSKTISGANYFLLCNYNLLLSGNPTILVPPVYTVPTLAASITLTVTPTTATIELITPSVNVGDTIMFFLTQPLNGLNTPPRKELRLIKYVTYAGVDTFDITAVWESYFGLSVSADVYNVNSQLWCAGSCFESITGIPGPLIFVESMLGGSGYDTLSINTTNDTQSLAYTGATLPASILLTDPFSISFWFKHSADLDKALSFIFGNFAAPSTSCIIVTTNNGNRLSATFVDDNGDYQLSTTVNNVVLTNVWYHVLVTRDNSGTAAGWKFYVNGVAVGIAGTTDTATTDANTILGIGYKYLNASGLPPQNVQNIDEVTLYNTELSASDATDLYNAGNPIDPTSLPSAASLTNYWRMGEGAVFPTIPDEVGTFPLTMINMLAGDIVNDTP